MLKKPVLVVAAACLLLLQGACSTNENNQTQPSASQSGQQQGNTEAPQSEQQEQGLDLSQELSMTSSLIVGKTTFADLVATYGEPIKQDTYKTAFRMGLQNSGGEHPQIDEVIAFFKLNPLTGEKAEKGFPLFFTNDDKKTLVASNILLKRGDLVEKIRSGKATLEDVKKVYGEPMRENEMGLEYYDFTRKIVMFVVLNEEGKLNTLVTKYDLLYSGHPEDLEAHEQAIQRLSEKQKKSNEPSS